MGLTPRFTMADVARKLNNDLDRIEAKIVKNLTYAGESFVKEARGMSKAEGGFGDVTGNLRSSIGYFIVKDGELLSDNLQGNTTGKSIAKALLERLKAGTGFYQLIGVAGMEYASYVEAKGFNVISMQEDSTIILLKQVFRDVKL